MNKTRSNLRPILAGVAAMLAVSLVYLHMAPDVQLLVEAPIASD